MSFEIYTGDYSQTSIVAENPRGEPLLQCCERAVFRLLTKGERISSLQDALLFLLSIRYLVWSTAAQIFKVSRGDPTAGSPTVESGREKAMTFTPVMNHSGGASKVGYTTFCATHTFSGVMAVARYLPWHLIHDIGDPTSWSRKTSNCTTHFMRSACFSRGRFRRAETCVTVVSVP